MFGLIDCGLGNVDLLEAPYHAFRAREVAVVFLIGGTADKPDSPVFKIRLQHVGRIHGTVTCSAGTDECMYLVDINDISPALAAVAVRLAALSDNTVHNNFQPFLKVATELCACQQCAHVELVDMAAAQTVGYPTLFYHLSQSPYESRLAYTWFANMQGIVLVAPTEHLNGALQLLFTSYQWIVVLVLVVHTGDEAPPWLFMRSSLMGVFLDIFPIIVECRKAVVDKIVIVDVFIVVAEFIIKIIRCKAAIKNIVHFAGADELTDKVAVCTVERLFQEIAGPGVVDMK